MNPAQSNPSSIDAIHQRRRELKGKRRLRLLSGIWRTSFLLTLTGGLIWGLTLPDWMLRRPDQVRIRGNQLLRTEAIQAQLPLNYPQSLLRLDPQTLVQSLETALPLQRVTISRQLFPPTLIVEVQERFPVAITTCDRCTLVSPNGLSQGPSSRWYVDGAGMAAAVASYQAEAIADPPPLTVVGYLLPLSPPPETIPRAVALPQERQQQWQQLFSHLGEAEVPITTIDWRKPENLIVQTALGSVHLGAYGTQLQENHQTLPYAIMGDRLREQLRALNSLKELPTFVDTSQLLHIDLVNPAEPLLQMKTATVKPPSPQPSPSPGSNP
ncbi:FtsQ-type POTRA domain-containing protein [Candidatus Synechococcus calcipolaris G9]|uniref:FtsQ-type POTRA domain-containing protein n=1 Tax=Candidatus Synechococcus calcipolaris G9 TaxID=1497997 RepID=A0ABT6F1Z9_9SYNE|nr:FtsQ-type POTRA domain-containing protein [Candidatus Synechococcus calcipolaris]MDG2991881.1 FtsQ-type POTRA domain-containing protein [Candidatus Synechococcus calcipolaris G9]